MENTLHRPPSPFSLRVQRSSPLTLLALLTLGLAACGGGTAPTAVTPAPDGSVAAANPDVALVPYVYTGQDYSWDDSTNVEVDSLALTGAINDLSAQPYVSAANGWGPVELNQSNGERGSNDGHPLTLNGKTYSTGLGVHAYSQLTYNVNGQCTGFQTDMGVDDEVRSLGSVSFEIWADGTKLFDSGMMTGNSPTQSASVDLSGRKQLKLVVTNGGDNNYYDHANWAGATLTGCTPVASVSSISADLKAQPVQLGAAIKDTAYPVPGDAMYVSLSGADSNPGTASAPLRTLTMALRKASQRPGVTIVMRGGVYREAPGAFGTRVTIQPYPHEQVWIKGSTVLTNLQQDGALWHQDNFLPNLCRSCAPSGVVSQDTPLSGVPDMVFVDNVPLRAVNSRAAVDAGSFYLDTAAKQIWLGLNPQGHTVEASVYSSAMMPVTQGAAGSVIRGLGFAQFASYAASFNEPAMVLGNTSNLTFENNTFTQSASRGLTLVYSAGSVVRGNTFSYNGFQGYTSYRSDHLLFEGNTVLSNNQRNFVSGGDQGEAAGVKIATSSDITARSNLFKNNAATGLWFDVSCDNLKVVSNTFAGNKVHGLDIEASANGNVVSNLSVNNAQAGIHINNTSNINIYNNVLSQNNGDVRVVDDPRQNYDGGEVARGITWITQNIQFYNNVVADTSNTGNPLLLVRDYGSSPLKYADAMLANANNNLYYRSSAQDISRPIQWWRQPDGNGSGYSDLGAFSAATERDRNSQMREGAAGVLNDPANGDYYLRADAAGAVTPAPLPSWISQATGLSSGSTVGILDWSAVPKP